MSIESELLADIQIKIDAVTQAIADKTAAKAQLDTEIDGLASDLKDLSAAKIAVDEALPIIEG